LDEHCVLGLPLFVRHPVRRSLGEGGSFSDGGSGFSFQPLSFDFSFQLSAFSLPFQSGLNPTQSGLIQPNPTNDGKTFIVEKWAGFPGRASD
jgi:hypothetical protein